MYFSIIVPAYNRAHILPICLNSLINQDYPKDCFEIIIVDNNSNDNTKEVVNKFIQNNQSFAIQLIIEKRQGLVFARHTGAKAAKFETLVYTDDDASLSQNWLRAIAEVYESNSKVVAVGTKILIRWDSIPPDWVLKYEPLLGKLDYGNEIIYEKNIYINGGSFSIKKETLNSVGGFNPGQLGDWIIGDSEAGLCIKLHKKDYLIGWTPFGVMEHLQFVKKHATIKDIARRYINNGRIVPYRLYAIEGMRYFDLLKNCFQSLNRSVKELMKAILYFIQKKQDKSLEHYFNYHFYFCQTPYSLKIIFSRRFRQSLLKKDWIHSK